MGGIIKSFLLRNVVFLPTGNVELTLREYTEGIFINSPKSDNSGSQNPQPVQLVKPPRNLRYIPEPQDSNTGLIGKNGELRWEPSLTQDVTYYSIRVTGATEPLTVPVDSIDPALGYVTLELYGYAEGTYTFECRAVSSVRNMSSSPVTLVVDLNSSKNLPTVTGFSLVNTANNNNYVWLGGAPILTWDPIPEGYVPVGTVTYLIDVIDPDSETTLSQYQTSDTTLTYPFAENKAQYLAHKAEVGAYRSLKFRIKAAGQTGELSVSWTYI